MARGKRAELYDLARHLFVFENKSLIDVQKELPVYVSMQSLSKWSQEGEWTSERKKDFRGKVFSARSAVEILEQALCQKVQKIKAQGDFTSEDAREIDKITTSIEKMRRNTYDLRSAVIEVMGAFVKFLIKRVRDNDQLTSIKSLIEEYFKEIG